MIVVYDGSFEGFLSIVYEVYYAKLSIDEIRTQKPHSLFHDDIFEVYTNNQNAKKVFDAIVKNFSKKYLRFVMHIFMCDDANFEIHLLNYIILGFTDQRCLEDINHPSVFFLQNLEKEYFRLYHKMIAFLRFEELEDESLYAKLDVKYNLLSAVASHFSKRFNNQNFIIHDLKRGFAFVHTKAFKGIRTVASYDLPEYSKNELKFKKLWKTFFQSVSIESRENLKLQQQHVPLIYRAYMSEFH